jgi:DNA repair protein RecN (Recombination protein N)
MLNELRIENLAVIERLTVSLEPGLNVLTGETGAGKSILVGALSLLLGERATAEVVREGAARARVEGVFDATGRPDVAVYLADQGIEVEDGLVILRREVAAEGRNRAWINGSASTAGVVGEVGRRLIDLHGQHEHQALLQADAQREILDAFAGQTARVEELAAAHQRRARARQAVRDLEARREEMEQRADLLRFQLQEIEDAGPVAGEEEELAAEGRRLEHAEELARLAGTLHHALYSGDRAVADVLGFLRRDLEKLLRIDPGQEQARELLDTAYYHVEELGRRMGDYAAGVDHDPARLEAVRQRQDRIFRLKSKYGPTLDDVLAVAARARQELGTLDSAAFERGALLAAEEEADRELARRAGELSAVRQEAARTLTREVLAILPALGLANAAFQVEFRPLEETGAAGAEAVEFLIAVNRGFEPRALARVASGGELSRIMLALKTVLARVDAVPTLVFDEIDAGIGGRVAVQVGRQLREVARHHQVFVVTHLPQIAARADHHLLVVKGEDGAMARAAVEPLTGDERVRELARMLGGDPESPTSLSHARELLGAG